mmetsp:Transcript_37330/g.120592  ORF Transcript_37330/g.120592 Transcript_37330/m.120592 type:complete len:244 (-) Transcript_37330:71-802(-)
MVREAPRLDGLPGGARRGVRRPPRGAAGGDRGGGRLGGGDRRGDTARRGGGRRGRRRGRRLGLAADPLADADPRASRAPPPPLALLARPPVAARRAGRVCGRPLCPGVRGRTPRQTGAHRPLLQRRATRRAAGDRGGRGAPARRAGRNPCPHALPRERRPRRCRRLARLARPCGAGCAARLPAGRRRRNCHRVERRASPRVEATRMRARVGGGGKEKGGAKSGWPACAACANVSVAKGLVRVC